MICRLIVFGCSRFVNKLMDTGKGIRVLTITAFISTNSYNRRINSLNCVEKRFITKTHMALKHDSLSKVCCLNLCAPVLFLNSFPGTWTPRSLWEHRICEEVKLRPSSQPSKKNLLKRGEKNGRNPGSRLLISFVPSNFKFGRYTCTSSTHWGGPVHFMAFVIYDYAQRVTAGERGCSFRSFLCQFQHIIWLHLQTPSRNTARQTHSGINKSSATVHLRTPFAPGAPKFWDSRCFIVPRCPVAARKAVTQLFARNVGE